MFTTVINFIILFLILLAIEWINRIYDRTKWTKSAKNDSDTETPESQPIEVIHDRTYGKFTLSNAVALFEESEVVPKEGYQTSPFVSKAGVLIERMMISVSVERIFYLFDDFLSLLGDACGVVVEDCRDTDSDHTVHVDHYGYHKDTVVVRSIFCDFEELLVNDGFLGVAVFTEDVYAEVQLTDHKTIQVFSTDASQFEEVLAQYGIKADEELKFVFDDSHIHFGVKNSDQLIDDLRYQLNLEQGVLQRGDSQEIIA